MFERREWEVQNKFPLGNFSSPLCSWYLAISNGSVEA